MVISVQHTPQAQCINATWISHRHLAASSSSWGWVASAEAWRAALPETRAASLATNSKFGQVSGDANVQKKRWFRWKKGRLFGALFEHALL